MRRLTLMLALVLSVELSARQPVHARHGMVVAQEPRAVDVGVNVLKNGGNAIDAAVAVGFALAVTHSSAGNIGGGGFMLVRLANGETTFIDFREKAPAKASHDMYLDANGKLTRDSILGWRAPGVPGTVRGFELAQKKFGKKSWAQDLEPAIDLAEKGFALSYRQAEGFKNAKNLPQFAESKRIFQRDGKFYDVDEIFRQPELAATLERIAKNGGNEFYEGETAKKLAAAMAKNGGLITLDDLETLSGGGAEAAHRTLRRV